MGKRKNIWGMKPPSPRCLHVQLLFCCQTEVLVFQPNQKNQGQKKRTGNHFCKKQFWFSMRKLWKIGSKIYISIIKCEAQRIAILISNIVNFVFPLQTDNKVGWFILVQGLTDNKEVTVLNVYRSSGNNTQLIVKVLIWLPCKGRNYWNEEEIRKSITHL